MSRGGLLARVVRGVGHDIGGHPASELLPVLVRLGVPAGHRLVATYLGDIAQGRTWESGAGRSHVAAICAASGHSPLSR